MAYNKQSFVDNQTLEAKHLNHMEDGIFDSVSVTEQELNDGKKKQARQNIGAIAGYNVPWVSVIDYGAKGDGATDDTAAFQAALAANRGVFVPGGTYKLSGTLVIGQNCCLELSQDTVLNFTQTSGACIEIRSSATFRGNHAVIIVPYAFTGKTISLDADYDTTRTIPPYTHWSPQWKHGRYVYDICIVKANSSGLHYSSDGACSGTAIYMHTDGTKELPYMWGVNASGIRIAGAFTYGINVLNVDDPDDNTDDDAWNHDMRIEAVIEGCETGVSMTNCNGAYLNVTVQPIKAENGTPYAKWGVYLNDCRFVDMSSSRIWDWNATNSLWTSDGQYQHIAMFGNCQGLVLSDYLYYESSSTDIRDLIYTDTPSNLEKMTILQEPITRYFKVKDGVPYYDDDGAEKKLATQDALDAHFDTDVVKGFTDVLPTATDGSGNIFNDKGYIESGYYINSSGGMSEAGYYGCVGFIPVKSGQTVYVENIVIPSAGDGWSIFVMYDSSFNKVGGTATSANETFQSGGNYYFKYEPLENGFKLTPAPNNDPTNCAYIRFGFHKSWLTGTPMVSVNEPIKYTYEGFLADGIKVKGDNILVYSPGGQAFKLTINDSGVLTPVKLES